MGREEKRTKESCLPKDVSKGIDVTHGQSRLSESLSGNQPLAASFLF